MMMNCVYKMISQYFFLYFYSSFIRVSSTVSKQISEFTSSDQSSSSKQAMLTLSKQNKSV